MDVLRRQRQLYAMLWQLFLLPAPVLLLALVIGAPVSAQAGRQGVIGNVGGTVATRRSMLGVKVSAAPGVSRGHVKEVRRIFPSEWGAPHPVGLSYSVAREQLGLLSGDGRVVIITPYEEHVASVESAFGEEADLSMAYDDENGYVLLLDQGQFELGRLAVSAQGVPGGESLKRFDLSHLGLVRADGMDVDEQRRQLLILDSGRSLVTIVEAEPPFALIETIDLAFLNDDRLREIAVHPQSGRMFIMGAAKETLYELSPQGLLLTVYDMQSLDLINVRGMDFGPSADLTDEPETVHLFLADSNLAVRGALEDGELSRQLYGAVLETAIISDRRIDCKLSSR